MFWKTIAKLDEKISAIIRIDEKKKKIRPVAIFFAHSGDSWFDLTAMFIVWLTTRGHWHHVAAVMAASTICLALVVFSIKFIIRRPRPEGDWGAIYRTTDPHSFPSGHAARTMMLAVLGLLLGPTWFGIILVVWTLLVSLARVAMGVHFFSDIVGGILLGIAAAFGSFALSPWVSNLLPFLF